MLEISVQLTSLVGFVLYLCFLRYFKCALYAKLICSINMYGTVVSQSVALMICSTYLHLFTTLTIF